MWANGIFVYCLSQQFREGTNVNKVLLNSVFNNKAKTEDMGTNQIMLMACLGLSLQTCCSLKAPELILAGEQAYSIRLGRYDVTGEKGLFIRITRPWNMHKKFLRWTLTWKEEGGGRSEKPLGLHSDNLKIHQEFRLPGYPKPVVWSSMKHESRARSKFDGSISSVIWLH